MVLQEMKRARLIFLPIILIAVFVFVSLAAAQPPPGEQLFLTGVVKKIDYKQKAVIVDVKNKGCKGIKTFSIDDPRLLRAIEGDKIRFYVDSATCPGASGTKMFPKGKGRKI